MNKRYLSIVSGLVVFALLVVWGTIVFLQKQNSAKLQGKLVFAKTFDLGEKVNRIVITTADDVIELYQENSYWQMPKHSGYYADFKIIHALLSSMNESVYSVKLPYSEATIRENYLVNPLDDKKDSGMLIQTYVDDEMLDEVVVGLPDENKVYFFAKRPNEKEVWLIDGNFNLPIKGKYWLLRPVFSVPSNSIESITIGKDFVQREAVGMEFADGQGKNINTLPMQDVFEAVEIVDAMTKDEFLAKGLDKQSQKVIDIITFYGLEVIFNLYYNDNNQVWGNIKLSTTPLPISAVNDYIRDNSFLYDDWFFELSPEQGHILRDFHLM